MKKLFLGILFALPMFIFGQTSNEKSVSKNMQDLKWGTESHVVICSNFAVSPPVRDLLQESSTLKRKEKKNKSAPDKRDMPVQTFLYNAQEDGDAYGNTPSMIQSKFGTEIGHAKNKSTEQNWAGQSPSVSFRPFDPTGAAGPDHYIQMINGDTYEIWNKNGTSLGAATISALWPSGKGDGDPIVLYDKAADRWFMSQFGGSGDNGIYIAVSSTSDPLGTWNTYEFLSPDFPDYLKFSAWQDGYYMTANYSQKIFAFNRDKILAGDPSAEAVYQSFSPPQGGGFFVPLPADASDGVLPGNGTPCPIFSYSDNAWGGGNIDAVNIFNASVNWNTQIMTVSSGGVIPTNAFDASYDSNWDDISQPGTSQKLDGIGGAMLFRAQWKTWSGYNTVVLNWGVQITSSQRGIYWVELRQNQSTDVWSIYQQGVYAPGTDSYWLGSIAMNDNGDIGLSYAKASPNTYMTLAYTGRYVTDPLGTMPMSEVIVMNGTGSQTSMNRVGDYSQTCLDPDGETFWHTGEYLASGGSPRTRIYSYKFVPNNFPTISTTNISAITQTSAVSGGDVTHNGGASVTERGIVWGLNANPTLSDNVITDAGTGLGSFTSNITGLSAATTYHVRAYATNANGTSYGIDKPFSTSCGEITVFPFVEGFEGETFPPNCWTSFIGTNGIGTNQDWKTSTTSHNGTKAAYVKYENVAGGNAEDWLVSPALVLPTTTASISYYERQQFDNDYDSEYTIKISTTSQTNIASFTDILTYGESDFDQNYTQRTIDLIDYVGQTIYIAFVMTNDNGDDWYVDDINIDGTSVGGTAPVANFSANTTNICEGSNINFTDVSTNTPTFWSWNFGDGTTAVTTQNPSHTYTNPGTYTVILTAGNSFGQDIETKSNYITVASQANAGTNGTLTVCEGTIPTEAQLFAQLDGSPDTGGTWSNSGLVYTYTVNAVPPCADATATVTVSEQEAPNAGTNGTLSICEGTTPTNNELNAQLGGSPDAGGTWTNSGLIYTYTVTAVSPCTEDATATVTITEQTSPNAGTNGSLSICEGTTPTNEELFAQLGGSPDTGGTWTNSGLVYTYTITAIAPCDDATATVTITEQTESNAGSNGTLTVCEGTVPTNEELFAQLGGSPDTGGTWTNSGLIYTYTITAISPCTEDATATVTVSEQAAPNAGTNGALSICEGMTPSNEELFAQLGGSPDTGGTWTSSGLIYTYTVTAISPCVDATATVTVTEQAAPNAGSNGNLNICEGTTPSNEELFAQLGGSPDSGGTWTNSGLIYTYTVGAVNPCTEDATATVTVSEQAAPDAGSNGNLSICEGTTPSNDELFAQLGGSPDAGGTWTNSGLIYTYTVTAIAPCADATATVTITEQAAPNAGSNGTLNICEGTTPSNEELFAQLGGSPEAGGTWTNSGLIYTYTVGAVNPCTEDATATVTVSEQAAPNAGTDGTLSICEGMAPSNDELFAQLGGSPDAGGTWTNSGLIYTYTVGAVNPCTEDATATITVSEQTAPDAGSDGTLTLCEGTSPTNEELFAQLGGSPDVGGTWTNSGFIYTYTVTAIAPCTEDATATVNITETPLPTAGFSIDASGMPVIDFTNTSTDADNYTWNFGDGSPEETSTNASHEYLNNGTYTVVLSAGNDCGNETEEQTVIVTSVDIASFGKESIKVFPNPAESVLNVILPVENVTLQLVSLEGKTLKTVETKSNKKIKINIEDYALGVYNLIITTENEEQIVVKVVKK